MRVVIIHGQAHQGSTYHITRMLADRLEASGAIAEEFTVNHMPFCIGCFACIIRGEELCPHRQVIEPIIEAIEKADVVIVQSPNYCMGMTGQLKTLFDHFAYRWISHRPHPSMKQKQGVAISTTAGAGAKKVTKDIKTNLSFWGIPKVYQISHAVNAMSWKDVPPKKKEQIATEVEKVADQLIKHSGKVKPGVKNRMMFRLMGLMQSKNTWNVVDRNHWVSNGWIKE